MNIITALQSAAHSSRFRCPSNVTKIQMYGEARGGYTNESFPFMGMRRFVIDYLSQPITQSMIDEAEQLACDDFDKKMWQHILDEHCGYLPVKIIGMPEGETCQPGQVVFTVESLDERCALLPTMIDKLIVSHIWFESTICQRLGRLRALLEKHCEAAGISKKIATYLAGGTTQFGDEYLSMVANALIFLYFSNGIDTNVAKYLNRHYYTNYSASNARISDHNSILMWDDESYALGELLELHSHEWFSILTDTFNFAEFFDEIIPEYEEQIRERQAPMSFAIDCTKHDKAHELARNSLKRTFGFEINYKGFRSFGAPIILTQLEELTECELKSEVSKLIEEKWSPLSFFWHISDHYIQENLSRSTNGFISKVCYVEFGTKSLDVCKEPQQDPDKKTRKGIQYVTDPYVYFNGGYFSHETLCQVRERLLK